MSKKNGIEYLESIQKKWDKENEVIAEHFFGRLRNSLVGVGLNLGYWCAMTFFLVLGLMLGSLVFSVIAALFFFIGAVLFRYAREESYNNEVMYRRFRK